MGGILIIFFALSMLGCHPLAPETMRHERGFQAYGANEHSETNLPAIRALLARERQQFRAVITPLNRADSKSPLQASAGDDVASSSVSPISRPEELTSTRLLRLFLAAPHRSTTASQAAP